jgi:hypothetical protein
MKKETLKNIFNFLDEKENKTHRYKGTLKWKLIFNEPLTKDELTVDGDLTLSNTTITSLPEGLRVIGDLDLTGTAITSLPKGLRVIGSLYLRGSTVRSLPEGLFVWGNLNLSDCKEITSLPAGLKVELNLYIRGTPLQKYDDDELLDMVKPSDDINGYIEGKIDRSW